MMSVLTIAAILFAPLGVSSKPQTGQPPISPAPRQAAPRDAPTDKKGTGIIRGRVVNGEGRALRRVQVRVSGEAIPEGRTASTNGLGRFEVRELPAGRYTLSASRAGYLGMAYGQSWPGEPGRPLELVDGQTIENADLVLPHTAIISGRVFDEAGDPLVGATVLTLQMRFFNGKRRLTPVRGNAVTDDTGQYRLSGLEPGEYYVQASSRETWRAGAACSHRLIRLRGYQGRLPVALLHPSNRRGPQGPGICAARVETVAGLCGGGDSVARAGDRCEHCDFLDCERPAAETAPVHIRSNLWPWPGRSRRRRHDQLCRMARGCGIVAFSKRTLHGPPIRLALPKGAKLEEFQQSGPTAGSSTRWMSARSWAVRRLSVTIAAAGRRRPRGGHQLRFLAAPVRSQRGCDWSGAHH